MNYHNISFTDPVTIQDPFGSLDQHSANWGMTQVQFLDGQSFTLICCDLMIKTLYTNYDITHTIITSLHTNKPKSKLLQTYIPSTTFLMDNKYPE